MNVITKPTSVAVLVTLGLALATVAAEDKPATQPTETKRVVFDRTKLTPEALAGYAAGKPWAKAFDKPKVSLREASHGGHPLLPDRRSRVQVRIPCGARSQPPIHVLPGTPVAHRRQARP